MPGAEGLDFRDVDAFDAETAYPLSIGEGEKSRIYKTADGVVLHESSIASLRREKDDVVEVRI